MANDQFGREVAVGTNVYLTGTVTSLTGGNDFINCTVTLDNTMPPSGAETELSVNTAQLVLLDPGQVAPSSEQAEAVKKAEKAGEDKKTPKAEEEHHKKQHLFTK